MLQGRLTLLAAAAGLLAAGCTGGPIEQAVARPAATALDQAGGLACGNDAATLRNALDAYRALNTTPAPDEAALVSDGFIRSPSDLWDVVDGRLVAVDPGCTSVPAAAPSTLAIVTATEPPPGADELYAGYSPEQVAAVGGEACARELAAIFSAADRYLSEVGADPVDLGQLFADGFLDPLPRRWQIVDDQLVPVAGSGCIPLG
ncbi:MAG TPA: hypothetical protein VIS05_09450 [Ilumatobacter sp.]